MAGRLRSEAGQRSTGTPKHHLVTFYLKCRLPQQTYVFCLLFLPYFYLLIMSADVVHGQEGEQARAQSPASLQTLPLPPFPLGGDSTDDADSVAVQDAPTTNDMTTTTTTTTEPAMDGVRQEEETSLDKLEVNGGSNVVSKVNGAVADSQPVCLSSASCEYAHTLVTDRSSRVGRSAKQDRARNNSWRPSTDTGTPRAASHHRFKPELTFVCHTHVLIIAGECELAKPAPSPPTIPSWSPDDCGRARHRL